MRRRAERVLQPGPHDQVLCHRLRRTARLADHVHEHTARIDPAEGGIDRGGVHVVQHRKPGKELPAFVVPLVPRRPPERGEQRLGAERRAADAQDQDVVVRLAETLGEGLDLPDRLALIHQLVEPVLAGGTAAANLRLDGGESPSQLGQARARETVRAVERVLQHVGIPQPDHGTSTVRPSYAGKMPSGSCPASSACPVSCVRWVR